jgi:hypothetical protein
MSKNKDRYHDDYLSKVDNFEELEELETPKFEKINHKKKAGKHHGHGTKETNRKEQRD